MGLKPRVSITKQCISFSSQVRVTQGKLCKSVKVYRSDKRIQFRMGFGGQMSSASFHSVCTLMQIQSTVSLWKPWPTFSLRAETDILHEVTVAVYYIRHIWLTSKLVAFVILDKNISLENRLKILASFSNMFSFHSRDTWSIQECYTRVYTQV